MDGRRGVCSSSSDSVTRSNPTSGVRSLRLRSCLESAMLAPGCIVNTVVSSGMYMVLLRASFFNKLAFDCPFSEPVFDVVADVSEAVASLSDRIEETRLLRGCAPSTLCLLLVDWCKPRVELPSADPALVPAILVTPSCMAIDCLADGARLTLLRGAAFRNCFACSSVVYCMSAVSSYIVESAYGCV